MATAELLVPSSLGVDIETLVDFERARMRNRPCGINVHPESFIQRVYDAHHDTISRWGGWRWHSPVYEIEDNEDVERGICRIFERLYNEMPVKLRSSMWSGHYGPPVDGWDSHGESHWPYPLWESNRHFYASRTWEHEDGEIGYACSVIAPIRRGQVVSRAILAHIRKEHKGRDPEQLKAYLDFWTKAFAEIGQHWSAKKPMRVTLSVAPSDFAWLGDIEKAAGSSTCYRTNGEYESSKYNIAATARSFVAFFYRGDEVDDDESPNALLRAGAVPDGRAWGFASPHGVYASNLYRFTWPTVLPALKSALEGAFGYESLTHAHSARDFFGLNDVGCDYAYVNADRQVWTEVGSNIRSLSIDIGEAITEYLEDSPEYLAHTSCGGCGDDVRPNNMRSCVACDNHFCSYCVSTCTRCSDYICGACAEWQYCSSCDDSFCNYCAHERSEPALNECTGCSRDLCDGCADFAQCDDCGDDYCPRCFNQTSREGYIIADCTSCNEYHCASCACAELRAEAIEAAHAAALVDDTTFNLYRDRQRNHERTAERDRFQQNFFNYLASQYPYEHGVGNWYQPAQNAFFSRDPLSPFSLDSFVYFNFFLDDFLYYAAVNGVDHRIFFDTDGNIVIA